MWFKLPSTILQVKDTGVIMSSRTIIQIQGKGTASSCSLAVNIKLEAQKAYIYHFMLPKALPKAMGNMAIPKRFPRLLVAVEGCLFISLWYPRTPQAFQPTSNLQCHHHSEARTLPLTCEEGMQPPLSCLNIQFPIELSQSMHIWPFLLHIYFRCVKLCVWHEKVRKCCLNTWLWVFFFAWIKLGNLLKSLLLVWEFLLFTWNKFRPISLRALGNKQDK